MSLRLSVFQRGLLAVHAACVLGWTLLACVLQIGTDPQGDANIGAGFCDLALIALGLPWSVAALVLTDTDSGYDTSWDVIGVSLALAVCAGVNVLAHYLVSRSIARRRGRSEAQAR